MIKECEKCKKGFVAIDNSEFICEDCDGGSIRDAENRFERALTFVEGLK